jgi:hypothetical protein
LHRGGDLAAVAVGDHEVCLCRVSRSGLAREEGFPIPRGCQPSPGDEVRFRETRVAPADEHTLLVARSAAQSEPYETWVELLAIDLETKQVRGHFRTSGLDGLAVRGDLVPVAPHHALLGVLKTVLCIDLRSFREVCRAREVNDVGDVTDADASPEEQLAPDGFTYDVGAGSAYLLCGVFNEAFLMRYRLEAPPGALGSERCRFVLEARERVLQGHDPAGLCVNPAGDGVTASFQVMDEFIDLRGQEVTDWTRARERMLGLREELEPAAPRSARLGCLCIFSEPDRRRRIDLHSEVDRDFSWSPQQTVDAAGNLVTVGYRLAAGRIGTGVGGFMTRPVYLDDRRVALGTPSGRLLCCNIASGKPELMHDFQSPINGLQLCRRARLLLVGCEDGGLNVLSV